MSAEPTIEDINTALTDAINAEGTQFFGAALGCLISVRNRKWTWFGEEVRKMHAVDAYIRDKRNEVKP